MNNHFLFLKKLIEKEGPDSEDYPELDSWIAETAEFLNKGLLTVDTLKEYVSSNDIFSTETMQGFALQKPHGYAGDFEIIYRIYTHYISSKKHLAKWDIYWQSHAAAEAVRNRTVYFSEQILSLINQSSNDEFRVLNLASGPCCDMLTFFKNPNRLNKRVIFDCIDQDEKAILFAKSICNDYLSDINFFQKNVLKFSTDEKYDLIWSSGLFDYFDNKTFVYLINKFKNNLKANCEIVVGNFSTTNPSKSYMEIFQWDLNHRSHHTLRQLGVEAGFSEDKIRIGHEKTGVNLFLHSCL